MSFDVDLDELQEDLSEYRDKPTPENWRSFHAKVNAYHSQPSRLHAADDMEPVSPMTVHSLRAAYREYDDAHERWRRVLVDWNRDRPFPWPEDITPGWVDTSRVELRSCPDCAVEPGQPHTESCDVERCSNCGGQFFSCGCPDEAHDKLFARWTGFWPGDLETRALAIDLNGVAPHMRKAWFVKPKPKEENVGG